MYRYEDFKPEIFKEEHQKDFLKVRDEVRQLLKIAGAFQMDKALHNVSGDSWLTMAYVDRMVELNEIKELPTNGFGQHRVFVERE